MWISSLLFLICLVSIWWSADKIVAIVENFSEHMRVSPFSFSFFVLGLFASIPEFIIGINSVLHHQPNIFVGNLLGGSLVLFGLVIPLLAIANGTISIRHGLTTGQLLLTLVYIAFPAFLAADKNLFFGEGLWLVAGYPLIWLLLDHHNILANKIKTQLVSKSATTHKLWIQLLVYVGLLSVASYFLVHQVVVFADTLQISPFYVSLLAVAIGGNIPELALLTQSLSRGNRTIAFGTYLGSAVANAFYFGILTLLTAHTIILPITANPLLIFIILLVVLFYFFMRAQHKITRLEGLVLISLYAIFVIMQVRNH